MGHASTGRLVALAAALGAAAAGCGGIDDEPDPDRNDDGIVTEQEQDYHDADWTDVGRDLVRPAAGPDPDARGRVSVGYRVDSRRFRLSCFDLDPATPVEVFVEDGTGSLDSWRTFTTGPLGSLRVGVRPRGFASLPADASGLADLKGRRIEVRAAAGSVLLRGTIPHFSDDGRNRRGRLEFEGPGPGVRLRTRLAAKDRSGRQIVALRVDGLAPGATGEIRIEDATATLVPVGTVAADAMGRADLALDSRRGDPLPFEEPSAAAFASRAVEVRVGGLVVASGAFPDP